MDTKSKSIKYSLWVKGLCLILSTALFALSGFTFASAFRILFFYGGTGALTGKIPKLTETSEFNNLFRDDMNAVSHLTIDVQAAADTLKSARNAAVSATVNKYLEKKAEIIKDELLYVAQTDYSGFSGNKAMLYDESRGEYQDGASLMKYQQIITGLEASNSAASAVGDKNAPLNIYAAQLIVNSVKSLEFLKYEDNVREEALTNNSSFYSEDENTIEISSANEYSFTFAPNVSKFTYSKDEIFQHLSKEYDSQAEDCTTNLLNETIGYKSQLKNSVNFKYMVKNNKTGEIIGNVETSEGLAGSKLHFSMVNGTIKENRTGKISNAEASALLAGAKDFTIYFWLENTLQPGDDYYTLSSFYSKTLDTGVNREIAVGSAALLLSILFFVILMCLSGHKRGIEGITLAFIDKLPWDIHFLISGGLFAGFIAVIVAVAAGSFHSEAYLYRDITTDSLELAFSAWLPVAAAAAFGTAALIFIELTASAVRIIKSGKPWTGKFAFVVITLWLFRCLARVCRYIFRMFAKLFHIFTYKPKRLGKLTVFFIFLYAFMNIVFVLLCYASPVFVLFVIGLNAAAIYFTASYARNLDKIITASTERSEFVPEGKVPLSISILADSLSYTNTELNRAISKAVRDERMKTELITNVSHDLKTPLTSVITYIDLLKKLEIKNTDAQKYIGVLEEKSDKLKQLIEDLLEASKVSTGNIVLNCVNLNLTELTVQAVVEATPDFEKNGLELRFDEPEKPPVIFADSQKTYRILENLLSNARKYSATGTRVYIKVYESGNSGVFEVKNISKDPLNISPEELTERFVRGDRSRSEEGNGLGLSIAKELTALQNGQLKISIDGDLFKAEVMLPSGK